MSICVSGFIDERKSLFQATGSERLGGPAQKDESYCEDWVLIK